MSYKEKGKIKNLAIKAGYKKEDTHLFVKALIAAHDGKLVLAAMSIMCYPNALRHYTADSAAPPTRPEADHV